MSNSMVRRERKNLGQSCFCRCKQPGSLVGHDIGRTSCVDICGADQGLDIARIECERSLKKATGPRHIIRGRSAICVKHALEIKIHRIWSWRLFRTSRFSRDQFGAQLIGKTGYDLVLHIEEVGQRLVEALGPKMIGSFSVYELDIYPQPISAPLY